jgi:mannan endo-1,6-alpha-mannosidase
MSQGSNRTLTQFPLASIKAAAKDVAFDVMKYYKGNQTGQVPGLLDDPPPTSDFYWWTGAALWSTMIDYWRYTGDDTYNAVTVEGLTAQNGDDLSQAFLPKNWTANSGNDDHGLWGMAAMQAAELDFPSTPQGQPSWIELAQAVFDLLAYRYSLEETEETCNGGLRWMMVPATTGYLYKTALANGVLINLGARLARFTGNQTYAEHAEKAWNWLTTVGLIDDEHNVFEGARTEQNLNCTELSKLQWSHYSGVLIQAAAYMYNHVRFLPPHYTSLRHHSTNPPLTCRPRTQPNPPGAPASTALPTAR